VKPTLRRVHRWLAFGLGALWLSQALTGLLMVFRWELDDAPIAAPAVPLDLDALGERIAAIEAGQASRQVVQLYATGGVDGRYDLYVDDADGNTDLVRVDGAGRVLRVRPSGHDYADAGFIPNAATLHQTLFAGDTGKRIVGISGLFLLATVVMGLFLAWPARSAAWRSAVWPRGARSGAPRRYAWHRAAGLWLALPAVVLLGAGVLMTFESSLEHWLGQDATPPELAAVPSFVGRPVPPAQAFRAALGRFPSAELSGAALPSADRPWYRIRVRQPGEWRRVYGTTVVYVAAADGRVLRVEDALDAPGARAFLSNLYPIHTGEAVGLPGRLLTLAIGAWLFTMLLLGFGLWSARRRPTR
jgi:uncharacterized iron-regulated membrane protein